jgi:hypothetical protein
MPAPRALALLFLTTASLWAQAGLRISSPKTQIIAGVPVRLSAALFDNAGNAVNNPPVTWAVNNAALAQIDQQGNITGTRLGLVTVNASSGNFRTSMQLQILPLRIDVKPLLAELEVGQQLQLEARAVDINGNTIPDVNFDWQATGANGGQINGARIDRSGMLFAVGSAQVTIRARVNLGGSPTSVQTIWGAASVRIEPRRAYRLRRLLGSEQVRHSFELRSSGGRAAFSDNGRILFPASLDGIATAMLAYRNGQISMVAQGGQVLLQGLTDSPNQASLNARGEAALQFWIHPGKQALFYNNDSGSGYLLIGAMGFGNLQNFGGFQIRRHSFNDLGDLIFSASFLRAGESGQSFGLFRLLGRRIELLVDSAVTLPGFGLPDRFDDWGADQQGNVWFTAARGPASALFRVNVSSQIDKILASGDPLNGAPLESIGEIVIAPEGGAAFIARFQNRSPQLVYAKGPSQISAVEFRSLGSLYQAGDRTGVLFEGNPGSAPWGLHRWRNGQFTMLLRQGELAPNGEPITQIVSAFETSRGELLAQVRTPSNDLLFLRAGTPHTLLFQGGDRVNLTANVQFNWSAQLDRLARGSAILVPLGNPASLFEWNGSTLIPRLLAGDRLPTGDTFDGRSWLTHGDDLYFTASNSLYRQRGAQIDPLLRRGDLVPAGDVIQQVVPMAVNSRGEVAAEISTTVPGGGPWRSAYYLLSSGRLTLLSPSDRLPDGRPINGFNEMALDDSGRVLARTRTAPHEYILFSGAGARTVLVDGQTRVSRWLIGNTSNLAGRAGKFYLQFFAPSCCDSGVIEYSADGWQPVLSTDDPMPDGGSNFSISRSAVNSRGDVATTIVSGPPRSLIVKTAEGIRHAFSFLNSTPQGEYLTQLDSIALLDDGRLLFTAFEASGTYALYVAEPIQ